jgi:hypothetical protein
VVAPGSYYAPYDTPPGPLVQVAKGGVDATRLTVVTDWAGGTGADFSLLVTCP